MKILIITNLYPPYERGGAELVVAREARELRDQGHAVTVLTSAPFKGLRSLWLRECVEDGIKVLRFFPLNLFWYRNDYKYPRFVRFIWHVIDTLNPHSWLVARRLIKKINPNEIHTHNLKGIGLSVACAIKALAPERSIAESKDGSQRHDSSTSSGIKLFNNKQSTINNQHFLHDVQLITPSGLIKYGEEESKEHTGWLAKKYQTIGKWLFGSPVIVRAPSKWVWDQHRAAGFFPNSKFEHIIWYPACHPEPFDYAQDRQVEGSTPLRFLFVGQLAPHKGILFLLQILKQLHSGSCTVDIVGDGPLMEQVKEHAEHMPWIHIHGRLNHIRTMQILEDTDCLLFPSLVHENCPRVIVEALQKNIPVCASKVGGVPEMIHHGVNGWLVESGNPEAWKSALSVILSGIEGSS